MPELIKIFLIFTIFFGIMFETYSYFFRAFVHENVAYSTAVSYWVLYLSRLCNVFTMIIWHFYLSIHKSFQIYLFYFFTFIFLQYSTYILYCLSLDMIFFLKLSFFLLKFFLGSKYLIQIIK